MLPYDLQPTSSAPSMVPSAQWQYNGNVGLDEDLSGEFPDPAPARLTAGIPDPKSIDYQKANHVRNLDEHLAQGTHAIQQQLKQQTDYIYAVGEQKKRQYSLQIDQEIKQEEMALTQKNNEQILMLQRAVQQQKAALDHQANALMLDFNQKKAHEDLMLQQYEFQKKHHETQLKFAEEMRSLNSHQQIAAQQVSQQHTQLAQHAAQADLQAQAAHQAAAHALVNSTSASAGINRSYGLPVPSSTALVPLSHSQTVFAPASSTPRLMMPLADGST